jgi:hypothetical protein
MTKVAGAWVLEVDVRKFFDTMDHAHMREFLRRRVLDGVLLRLIGKWLNAGVIEDGGITYPDAGSPQGGVSSPLLANIYLHEVLDTWFDREVQPRLSGKGTLIRYADDAVFFFEREQDARKVMAVLPKRFAKYGLTLHPEKTRLVEFRRPDLRSPPPGGGPTGRPGTFDLLGFTHFWGKSRTGKWLVRRSTAKDRFRRALARVADWLPQAPARRRARPAACPRAETQRALRVLRHHRELRSAPAVSVRGGARVACVAESPLATREDELGADGKAAGALPATSTAHPLSAASTSSESVTEEPGARVVHARIRPDHECRCYPGLAIAARMSAHRAPCLEPRRRLVAGSLWNRRETLRRLKSYASLRSLTAHQGGGRSTL